MRVETRKECVDVRDAKHRDRTCRVKMVVVKSRKRKAAGY